jgi:hypothetical protein
MKYCGKLTTAFTIQSQIAVAAPATPKAPSPVDLNNPLLKG